MEDTHKVAKEVTQEGVTQEAAAVEAAAVEAAAVEAAAVEGVTQEVVNPYDDVGDVYKEAAAEEGAPQGRAQLNWESIDNPLLGNPRDRYPYAEPEVDFDLSKLRQSKKW